MPLAGCDAYVSSYQTTRKPPRRYVPPRKAYVPPTKTVRRGKGDDRVRRELDQKRIRYTVTAKGDFKLTYSAASDRTQLLIINSITKKYRGVELRKIWSVSYKSRAPFSNRVNNYLLTASRRNKMGGWYTATEGNHHWAIFSIKVRADLPAHKLESAIRMVALAADDAQQHLSR
jgi:hypothetical protein